MLDPENFDEIEPKDVTLVDGQFGYNILLKGESVGTIEGVPGSLEHIEVEMHWEGKGVGREAVREFITLSREAGASEVKTNAALHPAMEHILKTEGFEENPDDIGWVKNIEE